MLLVLVIDPATERKALRHKIGHDFYSVAYTTLLCVYMIIAQYLLNEKVHL